MVEWLLKVGDGSEYAVENHTASGDAVACPDGGFFRFGFVYVCEDGG